MAGQYTTLASCKAQLSITDSLDDTLLGLAIDAASRGVDRWTGTEFGTSVATARVYTSQGDTVWVDRFTSTTGLLVKTGTDGTTYPTTLPAAQFFLQPVNAPARGLAYYSIRSPFYTGTSGTGFVGGYGFPDVQVTAKWGWDYIPADIELATRIKACRLFQRKDTPFGDGGGGNYGNVVLVEADDTDVRMLLAVYTDLGWA